MYNLAQNVTNTMGNSTTTMRIKIRFMSTISKFIKTQMPYFFLAACILMASCSASMHLGKATVLKPDMKETDQQKWFIYYQDQLDAYGGNAIAPPGEILESEGYQPTAGTYNQAAIDGYQQARLDWAVKVRKNDVNKAVGLSVVIVAVTLLPIMIILSVFHNSGMQ